jgi:predicted nucleic acid-binding protein
MNGDKAFVDTNLLIYMISEEQHDKRNLVTKQLNTFERVNSTQVLNETMLKLQNTLKVRHSMI